MNRVVTSLTAGAFALSAVVSPLGAVAQTTTTSSSPSVNSIYVTLLARQLRQGLSGEDVKLLQTLLAADTDVYPEALVTGYFGPKTFAAVKRFQKKNKLPQVGRVGPLTLGLLRNFASTTGVKQEDDDDDDDDDGDRKEKKFCVEVPPGHLIAPGWLKKNNGQRPLIPECQKKHPGTINVIGKFGSSSPIADTAAPVITNVASSSVTVNSATITWNTNEYATSWVYYGSTTPLELNTGTNMTSLSHSVNLSGLRASTTYMFSAVSKDASGNIATSSQLNFTTK